MRLPSCLTARSVVRGKNRIEVSRDQHAGPARRSAPAAIHVGELILCDVVQAERREAAPHFVGPFLLFKGRRRYLLNLYGSALELAAGRQRRDQPSEIIVVCGWCRHGAPPDMPISVYYSIPQDRAASQPAVMWRMRPRMVVCFRYGLCTE